MLDIFHESKGIISPSEWREFCSEVVPLFEAKRIFSNKETLEATVSIYDYGNDKILLPSYEVDFVVKGKSIYKTKVNGRGKQYIRFSLENIKEDSLVNVIVSVTGNEKIYKNTWRIFVFNEEEYYFNGVIDSPDGLNAALENGGTYIATPSAFPNAHFAKNSFIPVFWSPVHFPSEDPCGAIVDYKHPLLSYFPTEKYIDYQWKDLLEHSVSMAISDIPSDDYQVVMEMVPNYVDNVAKSPLFVMKQENAKIIFCGFDLSQSDLPTRSLRKSIINYINRGIHV